MVNETTRLAPILYIPHGGGPLPLMGDPGHGNLIEFLHSIVKDLPRPDVILIISAHWEEDHPTLIAGDNPGLLYDYYGFPPETYTIKYPAPGSPMLARDAGVLLDEAGFMLAQNTTRGFDHGVFVPLKFMYPEADIPCIQLSLITGLNPADHVRIGRALAPLLHKIVLIIGSGMSYHNLGAFGSTDPVNESRNIAFHGWLNETCTADGLDTDERYRRLISWESAPNARECHPREEHLMPLHVCYGVAESTTAQAREVFSGRITQSNDYFKDFIHSSATIQNERAI